jgi:hypothetical protein
VELLLKPKRLSEIRNYWEKRIAEVCFGVWLANGRDFVVEIATKITKLVIFAGAGC